MGISILNTDELRTLEIRAANLLGEDTLMLRAGRAAAELVAERIKEKGRVTVLVGPGNNGGDGLACACDLAEKGFDVNVVLPGGRKPKTALALAQLERWESLGKTTYSDPYDTAKADCVIDALFGIGLSKAIGGEYMDAVLWFNERRALKISLDIPSGLNHETGNWVGSLPGCSADITLTFLAAKAGLYMNSGADASGDIVLNELGVSVPLTSLFITGKEEIERILQPRLNNSNKCDYGRLAVIGGTDGFIGAAILASRAAIIGGAGLVTVESLAENPLSVDILYPEIMYSPRPVNLEKMKTVVIGCGIGHGDKARKRLKEVLESKVTAVIDADALDIIASDSSLQDLLLARKAPSVLTPHTGEAARLLRRDVSLVNRDRVAACRELAVQTGAIAVLKGPGTVISMRSSRTWINPTGSPALATAGSGDVLAGLVGAFLSQGYDTVDAVLSAVYFHGLSAEGSEAGFTASDIALNAMSIVAEERSARKTL